MKAYLIFAILSSILVLICTSVSAQNIALTFTAVDDSTYFKIRVVKVMNRSQGGDTILYWPDTVLDLSNLGIAKSQIEENLFGVYQNYPNPVRDETIISFYVPEKDHVRLMIRDILGRVIYYTEDVFEHGVHSYKFKPGYSNLFIFSAFWRGKYSNIKIISNIGHTNDICSIEYIGIGPMKSQLKAMKPKGDFSFSMGDTLLYIASSVTQASGVLDSPVTSKTYTFQFATNIPCLEAPTVTYAGQVYKTIQIFSQCWLKENLNVGWMIPIAGNMTDNGFIEKYCYNNEPDSCKKYGGLYQWNEMMQYNSQQGTQGICPPGWHLPTDEEWKILEGVADSMYGIGDQAWDNLFHRGLDSGTNLKSISGWKDGGNGTDLFGFSGLPGGSTSSLIGINALWWSSSESNNDFAIYRHLDHDVPGAARYNVAKSNGFSVRCIRDE